MQYLVKQGTISGDIHVPASKSYAQRALVCAFLSQGTSIIKNLSTCDDTLAILNIIRNTDSVISEYDGVVSIKGPGKFKRGKLSVGESGLALRLLTPVCALNEMEFEISGKGSILRRPVVMMQRPLQELGAGFSSKAGFPPIKLKGPIHGGNITIDGSISSQFLSGLLFALPMCSEDSVIEVSDLKSKSYVDMSIEILRVFGIEIENRDYKTFHIRGNQTFKPATYIVEGDWSTAAFLMTIAAVSGKLNLSGLNSNTLQPDYAIVDVLRSAGAIVKCENKIFAISGGESLTGFLFDATDAPDLFPVLTALAVNCTGTTKIKGLHRLKHKESDRGENLVEQFAKIGANIRMNVADDTIEIMGGKLCGGHFNAHNDHRIAMAGLIAGLSSENEVIIDGMECISKSFPEFFDIIAGIYTANS